MDGFGHATTMTTPPREYRGKEYGVYEEATKEYDRARVQYRKFEVLDPSAPPPECLRVSDLPRDLQELYRDAMLAKIVAVYNSFVMKSDFSLLDRYVPKLHTDEMNTCPNKLDFYVRHADIDWGAFKSVILTSVKKIRDQGVKGLDLQVRKEELEELKKKTESCKRKFEESLGESERDYQVASCSPDEFKRGDFTFIRNEETRRALVYAFNYVERKEIWEKLQYNTKRKYVWGEEYYAHEEVRAMEKALNRNHSQCGGLNSCQLIDEMEQIARNGWHEYVSAEIGRIRELYGIVQVKRRRLTNT